MDKKLKSLIIGCVGFVCVLILVVVALKFKSNNTDQKDSGLSLNSTQTTATNNEDKKLYVIYKSTQYDVPLNMNSGSFLSNYINLTAMYNKASQYGITSNKLFEEGVQTAVDNIMKKVDMTVLKDNSVTPEQFKDAVRRFELMDMVANSFRSVYSQYHKQTITEADKQEYIKYKTSYDTVIFISSNDKQTKEFESLSNNQAEAYATKNSLTKNGSRIKQFMVSPGDTTLGQALITGKSQKVNGTFYAVKVLNKTAPTQKPSDMEVSSFKSQRDLQKMQVSTLPTDTAESIGLKVNMPLPKAK